MSNVESLRDECIFCTKPLADDDRESLILFRGRSGYIMMNLFPYNTGHVMVCPFRHLGNLEELNDEERGEIMQLSALVVRAIRKEMQPQAFNLGMNVGKTAGAGYFEHLHMHVVPRWEGDTNFMPVLAKTKVMPESIEDTYERLRRCIEDMLQGEALADR